MKRYLRVLALCAFFVPAAIVAGCGEEASRATRWPRSTAPRSRRPTSSTGSTSPPSRAASRTPRCPKPPDFTECIAQAKKAAAKPAEGQPKQTDAEFKKQCKQQYDQLRDQVLGLLISFEWIEREAEEQGVKVTDAEVKKTFEAAEEAVVPEGSRLPEVPQDSGQTEEDILMRVRLDALSNKIRDKVTKGKDKVTDAQIEDYYDKNKQQFAQPERRDLRIVLTKTKAKAEQAKAALEAGQPFKKVAKQYSIDDASKAQGGKLPAVAKGQQEKAFDKAIFAAKKGELTGPVKTQFGYYVFEVDQGHRGVAAVARGGQADDQAAARVAEPAEGAGRRSSRTSARSGRRRRTAARAT